ncbi:hypothetical protein GCM10010260_29230 [Streptomyces filipinensis]|uniref:Uncharacterized protein n=1 Tax=Streptomyces filipinensis TaxID=66887 RepID=A0A918IAK5_9ACTN|nr:hypothetical protein GCM10010260_29230 [Streptomyces filipinensis]
MLFFATPNAGEVAVNSTRVTEVLGTSVWDLTRAEFTAHRQMAQIARFLRDRVPGFTDSYVVQSGVQVGVRETRRILGEYQLTGDDVLTARKFDDAVARGAYPVDIHNPSGRGTTLKRLPRGESYDILLRCLLPPRPGPGSGRGPLHLRRPRGALLLPRDADLDGHRAGGGRLCGPGGNPGPAAQGRPGGCGPARTPRTGCKPPLTPARRTVLPSPPGVSPPGGLG